MEGNGIGNAMGQRVAKHIHEPDGTWLKSKYYVRDAQGNVLAVYDNYNVDSTSTQHFKVKERHLYGSSRLGMDTRELELIGADTLVSDTGYFNILAKKQYELSNHLGNVLVVVTDRVKGIDDTQNDTVDYYRPHIVYATDYYPFGAPMNDRFAAATGGSGGPGGGGPPGSGPPPGGGSTPPDCWSPPCTTGGSSEEVNYPYGFNGMEKDDEIKGTGNSYDFGARIYAPRLGRWLSLDAASDIYPSISDYSSFVNNPILFVDPDGNKVKITIFTRIFKPKLARAYTDMIQTESFKNRFYKYMTAREKKKYYGEENAVDGSLARKGVIKFGYGNNGGDPGLTNFKLKIPGKGKMTIGDMESTIVNMERKKEELSFSDEEKNNTTFKAKITINDAAAEEFQDMHETAIHEAGIHLSEFAKFYESSFVEGSYDPSEMIKKGYSSGDKSKEYYQNTTILDPEMQHFKGFERANQFYEELLDEVGNKLGEDKRQKMNDSREFHQEEVYDYE